MLLNLFIYHRDIPKSASSYPPKKWSAPATQIRSLRSDGYRYPSLSRPCAILPSRSHVVNHQRLDTMAVVRPNAARRPFVTPVLPRLVRIPEAHNCQTRGTSALRTVAALAGAVLAGWDACQRDAIELRRVGPYHPGTSARDCGPSRTCWVTFPGLAGRQRYFGSTLPASSAIADPSGAWTDCASDVATVVEGASTCSRWWHEPRADLPCPCCDLQFRRTGPVPSDKAAVGADAVGFDETEVLESS